MSSPFQLLSPHALEGGFREALDGLRDLPPEHVLERHGLLRPLAREAVLAQIAREVPLSEEEMERIPEEAPVDLVRRHKWMENLSYVMMSIL